MISDVGDNEIVSEVVIMTMADTAHGPDWILWGIIVFLAILSIILISGHGSGLIAGYNTASKKEKEKYDEKKLCRVTGIGMGIITLLMLFTGIFEDQLPAGFVYVLLVLIVVDVVITMILSNTICKR